ncbi:Increased rDNA silencing protein [Pleosporales sp. CAS-2024a]
MTGASTHSTGETQHNVRDAALHGAFLAFSKSAAQPPPLANTQTGDANAALLAASKVGSPRNARAAAGSPAPLTRDWTGSRSISSQSATQALAVPQELPDRNPSPSNIAARLAAARHSPRRPVPAPPSPRNAVVMSERHANETDVLPPSGSVGSVLARLETKKPSTPPRKRRDSLDSPSATSTTTATTQHHRPADGTPIPPTTSLVKMFEQSRPTTPPGASVPLSYAQHSPPPVKSPKPQRAFRLPPEPDDSAPLARQKTRTPPPVKPKPKPKPKPKQQIELPPSQSTVGAAYFQTPQKDPIKSPPFKHDPTPDSPSSFKSAKEMQEEDEKLKPALPPPRRSQTRKLDAPPAASRPHSTAPVPIASWKIQQRSNPMSSPTRLSPPRRPMSSTGTSPSSVYHNNYQRDSVRQITKHMTGESLSSAIMGAALASSRNVSPAPAHPLPIEPLFPPRHKYHHHHSPFRRSPSPPKQSPPKATGKLRTTMRKEPSSSDSEDEGERYKKKGTRIMGIKSRKHPNKHHEGTRKRWRDQMTERERKRYEGVWAANKGLYVFSTCSDMEHDASQDVVNVAVQELWARSRLPVHVLEEVWDLVDSREIGRLRRDEFVVGLWLIDQRLKGRKLPIRVSDSVWDSARGAGVRVKVKR